ncbi:MAG: FMN-binding glutamate synthase family protein [Candidatus Melainabacteria bacterium]
MDVRAGRVIRRFLIFGAVPTNIVAAVLGWLYWRPLLLLLIPLLPLTIVGLSDIFQKRRSILRNFPVLGHGRYLMESLRPELHQYFIESNTNGLPFDRLRRDKMYQRAKRQLDTLPFGAQRDMYQPGYEWIDHSILARSNHNIDPRIMIGGPHCSQPYNASLLNVSAMSYGSLSPNAVLALNEGARIGNFAHNTGEGGISPYHLQGGGDLIYQLGTGYFGSRNPKDGTFCPERFSEKAALPTVKMIEIKLSQGAKPGHGGILPAQKLTPEIAEIRGVPMGMDVLSPPAHTAFSTPRGLLEFVTVLRDRSGGKPVGIKMCVGYRREIIALCKAMHETGIYPDYISVDGGEGGTGAAPMEFSNSVGHPLEDGLAFMINALVGYNLRPHIRVMAAGKITTGFDMVSRLALGADACYSARGMMFALGCIQALTCNTNHCPTGVATQDPQLYQGLVVSAKRDRVANFHHGVVSSLMEILGASGLSSPDELRPEHIHRRISHMEVKTYAEIHHFIPPGSLLDESAIPLTFRPWCQGVTADSFVPLAAAVH